MPDLTIKLEILEELYDPLQPIEETSKHDMFGVDAYP